MNTKGEYIGGPVLHFVWSC